MKWGTRSVNILVKFVFVMTFHLKNLLTPLLQMIISLPV